MTPKTDITDSLTTLRGHFESHRTKTINGELVTTARLKGIHGEITCAWGNSDDLQIFPDEEYEVSGKLVYRRGKQTFINPGLRIIEQPKRAAKPKKKLRWGGLFSFVFLSGLAAWILAAVLK